ncbi:Hsp70 nucleotide exchange factor FES1 [Porphyridium purpureum]|uniref:Hsp70 nucleotide exchange factor FES1 n=1 Tax=Porphyridium purpureum TaxID=35688 RepID=A0A5J4Z5V0_PORPP|nr:Hsp70 nucleotide exchange factor FES1 [Porphyridium purpureum]|eukprot:POR6666..scf295_1
MYLCSVPLWRTLEPTRKHEDKERALTDGGRKSDKVTSALERGGKDREQGQRRRGAMGEHGQGQKEADMQIQSLNELLKVAVEHTAVDAQGHTALSGLTPEQIAEKRAFIEQNKGVLDALFPDVYAQIRELKDVLLDDARQAADHIGALLALEEYMEDRNYAINIQKTGVLDAAVRRAQNSLGSHADASTVRVAAVSLLGSAMQDDDEVKALVASHPDALQVVVGALSDADPSVRAKGVRAISALLRNSPEHSDAVKALGGVEALAACINDAQSEVVRRRARFFTAKAPRTQNLWFVRDICELDGGAAVRLVVRDVGNLPADQVGDLEDAVELIKVCASCEHGRALLKSENCVDVINRLEERVEDKELKGNVHQLAQTLCKILA